jgi:hypothetical protein
VLFRSQGTKYIQLRKNEIEKEIKNRLKDSILCNGIIKFNSYQEKKEFLNSGAGTFGVHLQGKNVRFTDADFCNVIELSNFVNTLNLNGIKDLINIRFKLKNADFLNLEIPNYVNDVYDSSSKILDDPSQKIYIRFNSFSEAYKAIELFNETEPLKKVNMLFHPLVFQSEDTQTNY